MKTFKAICAALVLAISLSLPAYAEDPPPPTDVHDMGIVKDPGNPPPRRTSTDGNTPDDGCTTFTLMDILKVLTSIF
jgi:hypothetical protein